jgi:indoleamine 2,3-dioxygenase
MLGPLNIKLEDFYVSSRHGFLPAELPLNRLTNQYYAPWERIMDELPALLSSAKLKERVDTTDILSTTHLQLEVEWRRAYVVLSFLTHGYIWQTGGPSEVDKP